MAEDSDLERTEPASARRLEQAREEGQVPHSRELSAFLVLITAATTIWFLGGWFAQRMTAMVRRGLVLDADLLGSVTLVPARLGDLSIDALITLAPLFGAVVVAALASPVFLNAWIFSVKAFQPKLSRLNPLSGIGRIFSWQGLAELVKAVLKSLVVGGVAVWVISTHLGELIGLMAQPLEGALAQAGYLMALSFLVVVASMALIVAVDVPFQLWQYQQKMRMTREEVRKEGKELEGDPHVKGRIRSLQREAARRRMMSAVPTADVIVTNPTHFSVALSYQSGMAAPKVVAKGRGEVALRIRALAAEHAVPLMEAPPLARALYRWAELDDEVPVRLYSAVAEVLAYVYQLGQYRQSGGVIPAPPRNIAVPAELDPGVSGG
jgi:flagellar biosynthetic protein FlhB